MRLLAIALIPVAAVIPGPVAAQSPAAGPDAGHALHCPRTSTYQAHAGSIYRGAPLTPKKLTELPPATAYMSVYRRIGGCEAPLTMVEYRSPRGH